MTTCPSCNLEMQTAKGCTAATLPLDGASFDRIPHGSGKAWGPSVKRCSDCGAQPGSFHHPGCQYEECPKCGDAQMFACGCDKGE